MCTAKLEQICTVIGPSKFLYCSARNNCAIQTNAKKSELPNDRIVKYRINFRVALISYGANLKNRINKNRIFKKITRNSANSNVLYPQLFLALR